jgi:aspartate/methionine/tyrosine aminotransferase
VKARKVINMFRTTSSDESRTALVTALLFALTTFYFRYQQKQNRKDDKLKLSKVGSRGQYAVKPSTPYLNQFHSCLGNQYHPMENPHGFIPLCLAENKLATDMLAERFMHSAAAFADPSVYCYNSFQGMPVALQAAAYFLARRFLYPDSPDLSPETALQHVLPQNVGLGAGAAALLSHLFFLLGEQGDACLIPKPYYALFDNATELVAGVVPVGIDQDNPVAGPTDQELERTYRAAVNQGNHPRFILLNNPNNPLGTIYSPKVVLRIVQWARSKGMHTIMDEIYALGVHKVSPIYSIMHTCTAAVKCTYVAS